MKRQRKPPQRYEPVERALDDYSDEADASADTDDGMVVERVRREPPMHASFLISMDPSDVVCNAVPIGYKRARQNDDMMDSEEESGRGRVADNHHAKKRKRAPNTAEGTARRSDESDTAEEEAAKRQKDAEKRAKQFEKERRKKLQLERSAKTTMEKKRAVATKCAQRLRNHPQLDMIQLVPVQWHSDRDENGLLYGAKESAHRKKLMRWEVTTNTGQKTTFPGVTTVLNALMFSEPEPCMYDTIPADVVGYDRTPMQLDPDSTGRTVVGADMDVCGMDNEAEHQRGTGEFKCIGRGLEHGKLVHEQLSELIHKWLVEMPAFPNEYVNNMLDSGTLDPCVYKIIVLLTENGWTPIWTEYYIYDETLRLATAVDLVCMTSGAQQLAFIEVKTSTRKNALHVFQHGDTTNGRRVKYMRGRFNNHVLDTGQNRAAMQLAAIEAIMSSSYLDCRPQTYAILFVASEMPKAEFVDIPLWFIDGVGGQLGMNRRIIYNTLLEHAKHLRLKQATMCAKRHVDGHPDDTTFGAIRDTTPPPPDDMSEQSAEERAREDIVRLVRFNKPAESPARPSPVRKRLSVHGKRMMQHAVRRRKSKTSMTAKREAISSVQSEIATPV